MQIIVDIIYYVISLRKYRVAINNNMLCKNNKDDRRIKYVYFFLSNVSVRF